MKRGTPSHPKVAALMRALGINRREAVGLLEMLWHFTAQYARRGDIGHWPDDEIAGAVEWTDDARKLIDALVSTRWLDRSDAHRLVVHNWSHHADDTVRKALERSKEAFCDSAPPRRDGGEKCLPVVETKFPAGETKLPCLSLALPSLAEENPHPPSGSGAAPLTGGCERPRKSRRSASGSEPPAFGDFWAAYPAARRVGRTAALRRWSVCVRTLADRLGSDDAAGAFLASKAKAFAASDIGRGEARFIPHPATWLNAGRFDDDPVTWRNTTNGASVPTFTPTKIEQPAKTLTPDEIRAIKSSLASQNGHAATTIAQEQREAKNRS